jgi:hypothetical protein
VTALRGALPWAVVAVVAGAVIWWLLDQDSTAGTWLFGAFLAAHGAVHLLFLVPAPQVDSSTWPFDMSRSWTISRMGFAAAPVLVIGRGLIGLTLAGFILAALSTVGLVIPSDWWPPLVAASALASSVLLACFFDSQLVVGLAIDAVLLWVALTGLWLP